jgi:hypothetical protein
VTGDFCLEPCDLHPILKDEPATADTEEGIELAEVFVAF